MTNGDAGSPGHSSFVIRNSNRDGYTRRVVHLKLLRTATLALTAGLMITSCSTPHSSEPAPRTQLRRFDHWENFTRTETAGTLVLLSPRVEVRAWRELIVSWNAHCPPGTALQVEACAWSGTHQTRFYPIAAWTAEPGPQRTSLRPERDADAAVETDTLIGAHLMDAAQVRITLRGPSAEGRRPQLKFLALSFLNSSVAPETTEPDRHAWGTTLDVPERSQLGHAGARGWCSPTALSMMLGWWSAQLHRAELDVPVPTVAQAVFDPAYGGTGNWNFNTAYAGGFDGMRAYATRLDSLRPVEEFIAAGVPVALSVSFDLLNGQQKDQNNGHLIVVVGFTASGEVVVNDPWPNPQRENRVRKIFPRAQVMSAWQRSKQTVYVVVPEGWELKRRP